MQVSRKELVEHYSRSETDELLDLFKAEGLTSLAQEVLAEVLKERGVSLQKVSSDLEEEKKEKVAYEAEQRPVIALQKIKGAVTGLYVISVLQVVMSLASMFYMGVFYGIIIATLAFIVRIAKVRGAALAIAWLGGFAAVGNFLGPLVTGLVGGNLILSLIVIWLGIRMAKATKVLNQANSTTNHALNSDA